MNIRYPTSQDLKCLRNPNAFRFKKGLELYGKKEKISIPKLVIDGHKKSQLVFSKSDYAVKVSASHMLIKDWDITYGLKKHWKLVLQFKKVMIALLYDSNKDKEIKKLIFLLQNLIKQ